MLVSEILRIKGKTLFTTTPEGSVLEAVRVMAKTQLGRDLSDAEVNDLVAFLDALTGEFPAQTMPRLPVMPHRSIVE